jgi:hypothetical protein
MKMSVILSIILILAAGLAGCSSLNNVRSPSQGGTQFSPVQANLIGQEDHWGFSRGCYYTAQYQVFNTGNTPAKNVRLVAELVHINDNAVRDSGEVFIGTLEPGASVSVAVELDGECLRDYNVRGVPVWDQ